MSKISATIVADSLSPQGDRLTSVLVTFPRIILSEINTHRMLSKNTSSSRAIPFNKMVEAIENNPFIPIAWQRSHSGMQGTEYITDLAEIQGKNLMWLAGRDRAIKTAKDLHEADVTKQLANRLLEPFMWTTMLITGPKSGWDNFFNLRCPQYKLNNIVDRGPLFFKSKKDYKEYFYYGDRNHNDNSTKFDWLEKNKGQAEIHMMDLAEKIYDAVNESTPKQLQPGDWHIPFEDKINVNDVKEIIINNLKLKGEDYGELEISKWYNEVQYEKVKISVAMAARTSYTVVGEEKALDWNKMIDLHDRLLSQDPPHSSPFEHTCQVVTEEEYNNSLKGQEKGWFRNYKGFKSYRQIVEENK